MGTDTSPDRFLTAVPEQVEEDVERISRDLGRGVVPVDHHLAAVVATHSGPVVNPRASSAACPSGVSRLARPS